MSDQTKTRPGLLRRVLASLQRSRDAADGVPADCACGGSHEVPPFIAAIVQAGRDRNAPGAEVASREWVPAFADRVKPDDVINIPRSEVARLALRVLEVRPHAEGGEQVAATFLAVDVADATDVYSPTLSVHQGLRIAVAAPDSPAGLDGAR